MTIAIVAIPHQKPARIIWYNDRKELIDEALSDPFLECRPELHDFDNAAHALAEDWHSHMVIESIDDIQDVREYDGHQKHKVRAMSDDLAEGLTL